MNLMEFTPTVNTFLQIISFNLITVCIDINPGNYIINYKLICGVDKEKYLIKLPSGKEHHDWKCSQASY